MVAAVIFTGSLIVFYYTSLFEVAMFTRMGHVLMTVHFLLAGYLFIWSLVGIDPGPKRPAYPIRLLILLITMAFHAFFGLSLMQSAALIGPDWWHALGQSDDAALLVDQQPAAAWHGGRRHPGPADRTDPDRPVGAQRRQGDQAVGPQGRP